MIGPARLEWDSSLLCHYRAKQREQHSVPPDVATEQVIINCAHAPPALLFPLLFAMLLG